MQTKKRPEGRRGGQLNINMHPNILRHLKYAALDENTSVTALVTRLITEYLDDRDVEGRATSS